jgi:hypothetical protein
MLHNKVGDIGGGVFKPILAPVALIWIDITPD